MDIVGIGSAIIECLRIGRMIEHHGEAFLHRIYTAREIRYCQARRNATEHFAGRWAAKEAVLKCLGGSKNLAWTDMEIRSDKAGLPTLYLAGAARERAAKRRMADILLSIAHCRAYATAFAIALGGQPKSGTDGPEVT
jgi:holo-[acyl-carrier protein] synthase